MKRIRLQDVPQGPEWRRHNDDRLPIVSAALVHFTLFVGCATWSFENLRDFRGVELVSMGALVAFFSFLFGVAFLRICGDLGRTFHRDHWALMTGQSELFVPVPQTTSEDATALQISYAELKSARRTTVRTPQRVISPMDSSESREHFLELELNADAPADLQEPLSGPRLLRTRWTKSAALKCLASHGVPLAPDLQVALELPPIDLEPLREKAEEMLREGRGKEAYEALQRSPELAQLPTSEIQAFLASLDFDSEKRAA